MRALLHLNSLFLLANLCVCAADKSAADPAEVEYRSKFKQIKAVLEKEKFSGIGSICSCGHKWLHWMYLTRGSACSQSAAADKEHFAPATLVAWHLLLAFAFD